MESERLLLWIIFNIFVFGMLALDLGVFHRKAHAVSIKEAGIWSCVWVGLALLFNYGVYFAWGQEKALEFLTGYVIEKSLSVDNLFVFLMIFQYFNTPAEYQHRILFWGIVGALLLRAIFIAAGSALFANFHWMIYVFGAFLVFTGIKMLCQGDEKIEPENNPVVRLFQRLMPVSHRYHGQKFFTLHDGKKQATLMMIVLIVVETTDVIFAVDSIPAIFAVTHDPFIVYTSNVFAILGLRALYFMLAGIMSMFVYLKIGLSFVLCFVGVKMMLGEIYKIPIGVSLSAISVILLISVVASLIVGKRSSATPIKELSAPTERRQKKISPRWVVPTFLVMWLIIFFAAKIYIQAGWNDFFPGASADRAIKTINMVEQNVAQAKSRYHAQEAIITRAEAALRQAKSKLEEKRFNESLASAKEIEQILGGLYRNRMN